MFTEIFSVASYVYFLYVFKSLLMFQLNFKHQQWIENDSIKSLFPYAIDSENNDDELNINALITNCALLLIWAFHHSAFARHFVKQFIPQRIERSLYVLVASLIMNYLIYSWSNNHINGGIIYQFVQDESQFIVWIAVILSWLCVVAASFFIDHFELFGLKKPSNISDGKLTSPWGYKFVRHPMMSFAICMLWLQPIMTVDRFVFSLMATIYINFGVYLEEKDLNEKFGDEYRNYSKQVPNKFFYCPCVGNVDSKKHE